jgi:hypothetical protein
VRDGVGDGLPEVWDGVHRPRWDRTVGRSSKRSTVTKGDGDVTSL